MDLLIIGLILMGILYLSVEFIHKYQEKRYLEDSMNEDLTEDEELSLKKLASGSEMAEFYLNEKIAHHEIKRKDVFQQKQVIEKLKIFEINQKNSEDSESSSQEEVV